MNYYLTSELSTLILDITNQIHTNNYYYSLSLRCSYLLSFPKTICFFFITPHDFRCFTSATWYAICGCTLPITNTVYNILHFDPIFSHMVCIILTKMYTWSLVIDRVESCLRVISYCCSRKNSYGCPGWYNNFYKDIASMLDTGTPHMNMCRLYFNRVH